MDKVIAELDAVYAEIQASEAAHKKLLAKRDKIARKAVNKGVTWRVIQEHLHLSIRGLQLVLERTK